MTDQYDENSMNMYAHCPTFPVHTPLRGEALNCNIEYDVDKVYDNFVFPVMVTQGKQMEHFGRRSGCVEFFVKLIIFVAIMWFIIYILLQNK